MSSTNPNREDTPGTTDGAQNTDEHGRLEREEIADVLETQGTALESGEHLHRGRGEEIHRKCTKLATALQSGEKDEIRLWAGRLLNTVTEGLGDLEQVSLSDSTEALEHLQHLQFAIVEAQSHPDGPPTAQ
jgi:hypothetical protein